MTKPKGSGMGPEQPWPKLVTEDSFAALIRLFMSPANPKWVLPQDRGGYADATKKSWAHQFKLVSHPNSLGALSLQEIRPALVQAFFDVIADRPGKQEATLTALRQLEKWALVRDLLPRQITLGVEILHSDGGHIPWTDEQVAYGIANAPPYMSRAITLAAYTGQRGSDLVNMGWGDIEVYNGVAGINVRRADGRPGQQKTKRIVWVPILSQLSAAMETWERLPGPFLRRKSGKPMTRVYLTDSWRDELQCKRMEPLAGLHIHGLRAHAVVRLRRANVSPALIADMVGMSIGMIETYCRFSNQRENATAAVIRLEETIRERNGKKRA